MFTRSFAFLDGQVQSKVTAIPGPSLGTRDEWRAEQRFTVFVILKVVYFRRRSGGWHYWLGYQRSRLNYIVYGSFRSFLTVRFSISIESSFPAGSRALGLAVHDLCTLWRWPNPLITVNFPKIGLCGCERIIAEIKFGPLAYSLLRHSSISPDSAQRTILYVRTGNSRVISDDRSDSRRCDKNLPVWALLNGHFGWMQSS